MLKLSSAQRQVLAEITWNSRASVEELARHLSIRPHTVRYAIEQLTEMLHLHPFCFSDPFKQGLIPHRILFSVDSSDLARRKKMIEFLVASPEVIWLYEIFGRYQFLIALRTSGMQHLNLFLKAFDEKFGDIVVSKALGVLLRNAAFVPWEAHSGKEPRTAFAYRNENVEVLIDDVDRQLLGLFAKKPLASLGELSRAAGIPSSTVTYRVDKMVKSGVILGFSYSYDTRLAGNDSYLLLLKLHGLGGGADERFFDFCRDHPKVTRVARIQAEWDLEIDVDVESVHQLNEVIHQIYKYGRGSVQEVIIHSWGQAHKG